MIVVSRARQVALAVCQFFVTGTNGFIQPFLPLYVAAAGLSAERYGYAAAIGTATCLLIQPLLGRWSDHMDARRPVIILAALIAGLTYTAFRFAPSDNFLIWTLLLALGANGFQYLNGVTGVLVGRMAAATGETGGGAYVRFRVWGSVGYIVIAMTTGLLVRGGNLTSIPSRSALDLVFTYGPLLFVVVAACALFVPDLPRPKPVETTNAPTPDVAPARLSQAAATANRRRFLAAFVFYQVALYGASAYLSLFLAQLHAKPFWLTAMFAAGVVSEVLVMTQIGRWTDVHGRRPAMLFSFLLLPLRLLLYIPATGPLWVLAVQTLHGFNFGIIGTIAVVFINDTADSSNRGAAQAELAATLGLGGSIGPLVCGYLVQHYGIPTMFGAMSGLACVAALLFCCFVDESHPAPSAFASRLPRFLSRPWLIRNHEEAR